MGGLHLSGGPVAVPMSGHVPGAGRVTVLSKRQGSAAFSRSILCWAAASRNRMSVDGREPNRRLWPQGRARPIGWRPAASGPACPSSVRGYHPAAGLATDYTQVRALVRRRRACKLFPAHLACERIILPGPTVYACCGSTKLAKLGENVTETPEVVPRQRKVVQHVREKFTCRDCEKIN